MLRRVPSESVTLATARLKFETGKEVGRVVDLARSCVVGRAQSCDIVLADDSCSRMHARLTPEGNRCRVEDLGSTNGTLVNGERVSLCYLDDGDRVVIGDTTLCYVLAQFDGNSTVVLPGVAPGNAKITVETPTEGAVTLDATEAARVLEATTRLIEATRGVPDRSSIARALCGAVAQLLRAERSAVLLFRKGSPDPQDALIVSIPEMHLDPDRPWIARALLRRRALILQEESRSGPPLTGLVVPSFLGDAPALLIYADRRDAPMTETELYCVRHLQASAMSLIDTAAMHEVLRSEVLEYRTRQQVEGRLIGESPAYREAMEQVMRVARGTSAVLLIGETGTGKAMVARHLHESSVRTGKPFVTVNCATVPQGFMREEILGTDHQEHGPYGANHVGSVERAAGGTLFLDEIDTMDLASQAKLASVLRDKRIKRETGREIPADVRLVAASDRDLASLSQSGAFHEDLLALLALGTIRLPPLRERVEDIPLLADHFIKNHARRMNRAARRLNKEAMHALHAYAWPGNVRELSNVMERAVVLCRDEEIPLALLPFTPAEAELCEADLALTQVEKIAIERALRFCRYRKGQAARVLGISWPTLNKKIHDYAIVIPER